MNESTALAQRIALQLGGDIDRILPPAAPTPQQTPTQTSQVELRQIGGLTAGGTMPLPPGRYEFGQTTAGAGQLDDGEPESVGFHLDVDASGQVTVTPGQGPLRLDDQPLTDPQIVGSSVIDAGSARFIVARSRPPARRVRAGSETGTPQVHESVIPVPEPGPRSEIPQSVGGRLARMFNAPGGINDPHADELVALVRAARADLLTQRRRAHPDAEEVLARAKAGPPTMWTRQSDHWHFGQVTVALGDVPWRPRFDRPDRISTAVADAVRPLHVLPSAPMTADLRGGPLGVVGSRAAVLAVARHVMISLSTLSSPEHLELAVLADPANAHDWGWADALPHTAGSADIAMPVLVVDGMEQLDDGIGAALTLPGGVGAVLLTDRMESLPPICATVLLVNDDGTCTVIDHRDGATTMGAVPLGMPLDLALEAAAALLQHAPITI